MEKQLSLSHSLTLQVWLHALASVGRQLTAGVGAEMPTFDLNRTHAPMTTVACIHFRVQGLGSVFQPQGEERNTLCQLWGFSVERRPPPATFKARPSLAVRIWPGLSSEFGPEKPGSAPRSWGLDFRLSSTF